MTIIEILDLLNISYRLAGDSPHVTSGWAGIICPFCDQGQGKFGLGIHLTYLHCNCWKCGGHSTAHILSWISGEPSHKIQKLLGDIPSPLPDEPRPQGKLSIPLGVNPMLPAHRSYLRSRKLNIPNLLQLWQVQGIGIASRLPWRIFIPIIHHGRTVSWTTRSLSDDGLRYIAAKPEEEERPAKSVLYGSDYARHSIIICEGPIDVWKIGPGAVATLGTSYTRAQLLRMSKYIERTVCFDNDPIAQERAFHLCRDLEVFPGVTRNVVLDAKDPGSANKREIHLLRKEFLR